MAETRKLNETGLLLLTACPLAAEADRPTGAPVHGGLVQGGVGTQMRAHPHLAETFKHQLTNAVGRE